MAQLKDLIVLGASRLVGNLYANLIQLTKLNVPTTSNGSTYGAGTSGQVLKTNGTSVYWGNDNNDNTTYTASTSKMVVTQVANLTSLGSAPSLSYTARSVGSASDWSAGSTPTLGTEISADDITAWDAGSTPTLGTAIPADDITAWDAGSVPTLGTAIPADDITDWNAGSVPTLGTAIPADDITAWTTNTPTSFSVSGEKLSITPGSAASLSYTAKSIPNVTSVGTLPSLSYTAKSIPNVTSVGTKPTLSYTAKSIPNVTSVGTKPSLTYTERSIPNVTSVGTAPSLTITSVACDDITAWSAGAIPTVGNPIVVATGDLHASATGATVVTGITAS